MTRLPFLALSIVVAMAAGCGESRATPQGRGGDRRIALEAVARLDDAGQPILARPEWMSVDSRGRFFITDFSDKDIKVYDARGRRVLTLGRPGRGPGEFQSLWAGALYGDSMVAYDMAAGRTSVFGPDGRFLRSLQLVGREARRPYSVRVVDDSLFLLIASPIGNADRNLLTLVRADGSQVSSFFNQSPYFGKNAQIIQFSAVSADAANGVVFAAMVGGDSVWAFDYSGRQLGAGPVDPVQPLVSLKTLLERNGGRPRRADGTSIRHGNRNVVALVALDSASVALQVAPYDAAKGVDLLEGGTLLVAGLAPGGGVRTLSRSDVVGGLTGRDPQGRPLLLRYASPEADQYEILRVTLVDAPAGDGGTRR